jgi:hypothetical protein
MAGESGIDTTINNVVSALAFIGIALSLTGWLNKQLGVAFFAVGIIVLIYRAVTAEWTKRNIPGMFVFLGAIIAISVIVGISYKGVMNDLNKKNGVPAPGASVDVLIGPNQHRTTVSMPREGWTSEYGSRPPNIVYVRVNAEPFVPYAAHLQMIFAIKVQDNTIDEMQDSRIEISNVFHPTHTPYLMEMTASQEFMKRVLDSYPAMVTVSPIVLPEDADAKAIHTLADVGRLKGYVLVTQGFVMSVKKHTQGP